MITFTSKTKTKMLRTIVIDDEDYQRAAIEKVITRFCPNVSLVGSANSVGSGIASIKKNKPDLVLLDIKMGDGTGFDLLEKLDNISFKVIFITAFDQYAIKAFRFSAIDYLLKPLDPDDLVKAVEKAEDIILKDFDIQLKNLKEHLIPDNKSIKKIIIKTFDNIHLVPVNEIIYFESDGNYVNVYLADQSKIMVSALLKEYEDLLNKNGFFRVHRSYLINMKYIRSFEKAEGGTVILENHVKIPVASRKRDELLEMFEILTRR
jgi:two-component system LytT family response regulator